MNARINLSLSSCMACFEHCSLFGFYYDKKSISELFVNRLEMRFQIPLNNLRSESQCFNRSIINFFGFQYCNKRSTCTSFERGWHQISSSDDNDTGKEKVFTKLFRHCSPFPHLNPCSLKVIGIPSQNHITWQHDALTKFVNYSLGR